VAASVRKMSNQEADECAALIVEIFGLMCRVEVTLGRAPAAVMQLHRDRDGAEFDSPALAATN